MKITQALLAEHVVFHNMFDYLERTAPKLRTLAEVKSIAGLMEAMLHLHSTAEDELLLEPLEPSFEQMGQEENFHAEHEEIDESLRRVRQTRSLAEAKRLLLNAVVYSRKHFDKEERIVFPLAEKHLSPQSQELLGRRWAEKKLA